MKSAGKIREKCLERGAEKKSSRLEKGVATATIVSLFGSVIALSGNMTGNVVSSGPSLNGFYRYVRLDYDRFIWLSFGAVYSQVFS